MDFRWLRDGLAQGVWALLFGVLLAVSNNLFSIRLIIQTKRSTPHFDTWEAMFQKVSTISSGFIVYNFVGL